MLIYNSNLEKVTINEENYLNCGHCARVYKEGNFVKKVYNEDCSIKNRIDYNVYEIIKKINSENLIEIHELYYDYLKKYIKGYLASYYKSDDINILEENISYTLDNFHNIKLLFDNLASNFIKVDDLKFLNTILKKEKIVILDPDLFKIVNCSEVDCIKHNDRELIILFKSIYKESISKCLTEFKDVNPYFILDDLFKVSDNLESDLSKKLTKYKYPIEYFKRK